MGFDAFLPHSVTIDANGRIVHRGDLGIRATTISPLDDPYNPQKDGGATSTPTDISAWFGDDNSIRRRRESVLGRV